MEQIITINNDTLTLKVSTLGAQMTSLECNGKEILWQKDPKIWNNTAPILFPVCGRLWDEKYIYNGKEYQMGIHGFIRFSDFNIDEITSKSITLSTRETAQTKEQYPFNFTFTVKFILEFNKVNIVYKITNTDNKEMFFSVGGHEGFNCPEGVENYYLEFPDDDFLIRRMLPNGFFDGNEEKIPLTNHKLALKYNEFERCTYILRLPKSKNITLSNGNRTIKMDLGNSTCVALWTLKDRKYLCIEPWNGCSETYGHIKNIADKEGIIAIKSGESFSHQHSIIASCITTTKTHLS